MELLHPGVYVQEVPSGVRPKGGVSPSTAAFIGPAERGPLDHASMVTSSTEFEPVYGGFLEGRWLAHSALHFFNNGGRRLYVVRVAKTAAAASVALADRQGSPAKTVTITANSLGKWGNTLVVAVDDGTLDSDDEVQLTVLQEKTTQPPLPLPL